MRKMLLLAGLPLLLVNCSSSSSDNNTNSNTSSGQGTEAVQAAPVPVMEDFPAGQIIKQVKCRQDSTQGYSLYLPKEYRKDKPMAIIYFFDPHARGVLPLNKYKELADKYHFIFAASNTSKNGLSSPDLDKMLNLFFQDTRSRIALDPLKVYTAGFSGGAKVASLAAMTKGSIQGVIGSGAGFPALDQPLTSPFNYFGIVGDADFNYSEMMALNKQLDQSPLHHQVVTFEGKHEWPPLELIEEGIQWMQLQAMKNKQIPANDTLVSDFISQIEKKAFRKEAATLLYEAGLCYWELISSLDGIKDVSNWKTRLDKLQAEPVYKVQSAAVGSQENRENTDKNNYLQSFQDKDVPWWLNEIHRLKKEISSKKGMEASYLKRQLAFISMVSFMQTNSAIQHAAYPQAEHFLTIFKEVDPQNSDVPYFYASLAAVKGDKAGALNYLRKAVALGFDDKDRLNTDPALAALRDDPAFKEVMNSIKL